jgi:DNA-binding response OmpR family regulator
VRGRAPGPLVVGELEIDMPARRAWFRGAELELTTKEFDLLALLARNAGTVVTREEIMTTVWDEHWFGPTKTLDVHISWLRKKLGEDAASSRYITTVRGVGFRFEAG